jgi:hypothetical protein
MDSKTEPASEAKERIEKEATNHGLRVMEYTKDFHDGINTKDAYIAGARSEHTRAAQQLSEYKEVIKELLPIAERMQSACESGETLCYDNDLDLSDAKNYKSAIDRAKALLQESNQGQPPPESEQP